MADIKYTTDGRKVVVIGNLNAQEKIVQEVYVSNGAEIPSGENFVVKSLHDAPVISWKEKNLKELEGRYDKDRKQWEDRISDLRKKYTAQSALFTEKITFMAGALKNADENSFTLLVDYICGNITHLVICEYDDPKVCSMSEFNELYDGRLRLLSFFGSDNGSFSWKVGQYYDGSGSSNTKIIPCRSKEEAIAQATKIILDGNVSDAALEFANKYNITLDRAKIDAYKESGIKSIEANITSYNRNIYEWKERIEELNKL